MLYKRFWQIISRCTDSWKHKRNISQVMLGQIGFKLTAEHPSFPLFCIIHFPVCPALGVEGQTKM